MKRKLCYSCFEREKGEFMDDNNEIKDELNQKSKKNKKIGIIIALVSIIVAGTIIYTTTIPEKDCTNDVVNDIVKKFLLESDDKPIIYLYPETTTELTVKLGYPEKITCSYPKYENEWNVIANPDGTLIDTKTGRNLYALYWEGIDTTKKDKTEGFVIKGEETAEFLEEKLAILGLTPREAEEFIVYWLPKLEANQYNYIRFASPDEINQSMPLEFSQKPDTLIRILMQFEGLDEPIEVEEQKLETPERTGFVAVEWGGTEIK